MQRFINVDTFYYYMFIEKRKQKNSIKYYLVYSYREGSIVKKIRRYLGLNLSLEELKKAELEAKKSLANKLEALSTEIFNFFLTKKQVNSLNKHKIKIHHLDKKEWQIFTEEFVYNTNAIEGSTVQLKEVKDIIEKHKTPKNHEEIESKNVAKAVDFIRKTKQDLSLELIKTLHKICFEGTKSFAGQFRNVEVVIKNNKGEIMHVGIPSDQLKPALDGMISWYKKNKKKFRPLVLAAIIHNQFEHIHPFQDGNGRVGRLLLNFILLRNKYPPIDIMLEGRAEYYHTLQEYSKKHNLKPTIKFLIRQYNKMLKKVTTKKKNDKM